MGQPEINVFNVTTLRSTFETALEASVEASGFRISHRFIDAKIFLSVLSVAVFGLTWGVFRRPFPAFYSVLGIGSCAALLVSLLFSLLVWSRKDVCIVAQYVGLAPTKQNARVRARNRARPNLIVRCAFSAPSAEFKLRWCANAAAHETAWAVTDLFEAHESGRGHLVPAELDLRVADAVNQWLALTNAKTD
jgi:hypothetical protein